ncbi:sigma-70 family RNA polymerase sigma factor [Kribbella sp. VKM Ac-2566]|uniref:sigma-70 family RNA polymerase sigma factor n=1 Tax=Kribbella sp. VKM Ac-2566 TaxID=2512218 RepID=UPI001062B12D|nr:sigma-70 family RNA polymerase sigma factor [Kribbella sp. VKM Ac-2566]TDX04052.1 RNA polymerase sigma-70 factor (ECF subfamily) [Kribbella sp. VKM Ac-2566]
MSGVRPVDEQAVRAMYEQHASALLAFVRRLSAGDRLLAEDIVQETLLRAWQKSGRVPIEQVRPWLFTTARRLVIDAHRRRSARPPEASADLPTTALGVESEVDMALDAALVTDALRSLSVQHRTVLIDYFYRRYTTTEIAADRGLPAGTVRSRVHYGLQALRLALQERGVDGP